MKSRKSSNLANPAMPEQPKLLISSLDVPQSTDGTPTAMSVIKRRAKAKYKGYKLNLE